jgi:CubicO group peptidase (beta-lactamase class C family)
VKTLISSCPKPYKMKKLLTITLVAFALIADAQTKSIQKSVPLTSGTPESAGMSSERIDRIDAMCQEAVKSGDLPGIVALVARNGKIVFHEAYGMADNTSIQEDEGG